MNFSGPLQEDFPDIGLDFYRITPYTMVLENKLPVADGERSLSLMVEKGGNLPLIKQKNLSLIKKVIYRSSPISQIGRAHV